jgi:hypothetical protein
MSERHIAVMEVSSEMIMQALSLPNGTRLLRIYQDPRPFEPRSYFLTIEHPELPIVREGEIPRNITPRFSRTDNNPLVMDNWGL